MPSTPRARTNCDCWRGRWQLQAWAWHSGCASPGVRRPTQSATGKASGRSATTITLRSFYAFGEFFQGTSPLYFARALLVKVSLPTLILAVVALLPCRSTQPQPYAATRWLLIVPPIGYYAIMAGNAPAIGVRYVLPVLPFLFMLAGKGGARLLQRPRARLWLIPLGVAHIASLAIALRATPIAFFNGLFCSTGDALPCLDDSNVDWGQALPNLKRFRDERYPNTPIRIFYFGSSPPDAYVDRASVATPDELARPQAALYAMSVHLRARCPLSAWPRQLAPSHVVGGVYAIFDLRAPPR